MERVRSLMRAMLLLAGILQLGGCGGGSGNDSGIDESQLIGLSYDAVPGEAVKLGELMFPDLVTAREAQIEQKWGEIDAVYEQLALIPLPEGYTPQNVCVTLKETPDEFDSAQDILDLPPLALDPYTEAQLSALCTELTADMGELSNLQEAVDYAADYLWQSNNESVALVSGSGLALVTDEGVATITVSDAAGNPTHKITINASRVVQKIHQLQIQNEKVVRLEEGLIESINPDGTVKAQLPLSIEAYDEAAGTLSVSGPGVTALAAGQTLIIAPETTFPEGTILAVNALNDLGGGILELSVATGDLASVIQELDMEQKEGVNAGAAESTPGDTDLEQSAPTGFVLAGGSEGTPATGGDTGAAATEILAEGVRRLSAEEFRERVRNSQKGQEALKAIQLGTPYSQMSDDMLITAATLEGNWSPDFAYEFDKTDSQDNESDGWGHMGLKGTIGFSMPIRMYLRYSDWKLQRFITSFKPTQYADIEVSVTGDADIERSIAEVRGPRMTFSIGPVPVYMRPVFELSVGGRAKGDNVTLKVVDYEVWNKYGVDYKRGRSGPDWQPIAHYDRSFKGVKWTDGDAYLRGWGQVETKLKFYGMGGPYARAQIGARLKADTSKTAPGDDWASLESYVHVSTGVGLDITVDTWFGDATIVDYDHNFGRILDLHREEWSSGGPYVP